MYFFFHAKECIEFGRWRQQMHELNGKILTMVFNASSFFDPRLLLNLLSPHVSSTPLCENLFSGLFRARSWTAIHWLPGNGMQHFGQYYCTWPRAMHRGFNGHWAVIAEKSFGYGFRSVCSRARPFNPFCQESQLASPLHFPPSRIPTSRNNNNFSSLQLIDNLIE